MEIRDRWDKLLASGQLLLKDELIWGEDNAPSLYIHRIASNPSVSGARDWWGKF